MPRALLIDDDRNIVRTLAIYLEEKGFTVSAAGSAQEGLLRFSEHRPELVMLLATSWTLVARAAVVPTRAALPLERARRPRRERLRPKS